MRCRLLSYAISLLLELGEATLQSTSQTANDSFLPFVSCISHYSEALCHREPCVFRILRLKLPPSKTIGISCCLSIRQPSEWWCLCVSFWAACCCICHQKMGALKLGGVLAVWLEVLLTPVFSSLTLGVLAGLQSSYAEFDEAAYCTICFTGWLGHTILQFAYSSECCLRQRNKTPVLWLLEYFKHFSVLHNAVANEF